jgi:DNA-binding response OmpR family regulator
VAHILIIDDDKALRSFVDEVVRAAGHTTDIATNGLDALRLFRASPADVIITDIMMPYDGFATIRIAHAEFPKTGIIAMSGGGVHRLDYARGAGANFTLAKPFTVDQLGAAVAAVLARAQEPATEPKE